LFLDSFLYFQESFRIKIMIPFVFD